MLPDWLIKKIDRPKEKFIQKQLRIEEYSMPLNIPKEDEIKKESIIIIELF